MPVSTTAQSQIQDIAAKLRKAVEEEDNRLSFDAEVSSCTNRGNKLKRKAGSYREGRLGGQRPYKKRIDHAGHRRYILHINPRRYDEDGYELDAEDEDPEADEAAAELNPYSHVLIQDLLMPLTAASELEQHPTLSLPYKSKVLPNMVQQACSTLHKERRTLVELKSLLTKFRGDQPWIPCGAIFSESDVGLFSTDIMPEHVDRILVQKPNGALLGSETETVTADDSQEALLKMRLNTLKPANEPVEDSRERRKAGNSVQDATNNPRGLRNMWSHDVHAAPLDRDALEMLKQKNDTATAAGHDETTQANLPATDIERSDPTRQPNNETADGNSPHQAPPPSAPSEPDDAQMQDASARRPRMLTRHQAQTQAAAMQPQAELPTSPPISSSPTLPIHPLYTVPTSALPDRNFGLPEPEAEETRRILSALVQKQEEVARGASALYEGLLKAQRLSKTVWRWCRAEGHVGEMSDGEDWVDLEEWGLEVGLKKGMEEGEGEGMGLGLAGRQGIGQGAAGGSAGGTGSGGAGGGGGGGGGERKARGRKGLHS